MDPQVFIANSFRKIQDTYQFATSDKLTDETMMEEEYFLYFYG
jgi:hypothetical protein